MGGSTVARGELDHPGGADGQGPGELLAHVFQPAPLERGVDQQPALAFAAAPAVPAHHVPDDAAPAAVPLGGGQHVVLDGQPAVGLDPLEGPTHTEPAALHRLGAADVPTLQQGPTGLGAPHARDHVEERGLAGAVGPDETADLAGGHLEADVGDRRDPAEAHADVGQLEGRGTVGDGGPAAVGRTSTSLMCRASPRHRPRFGDRPDCERHASPPSTPPGGGTGDGGAEPVNWPSRPATSP